MLSKIKIHYLFTKTKNVFLSLLISIFSIAIWPILALNFTPIYKISIKILDIPRVTSLSEKALIINYNILIKYLQVPFIYKLKFQDFPMSPQGEYHFTEVKNIFLNIYSIVFALLIFFLLCIYLYKKKKLSFPIEIFNYTFYILSFFSLSILYVVLSDFSKTFDKFHKLFFNNNYWLFDPRLDPVINALPEEFFMICGVIILCSIIVEAIILKVIYHKQLKKQK
ncbi:membrane protein [Clostridium polyendosporum]|uniref:Membrane protein n=1 Tax=Clostridium polyendosporum TaxID=69208 RepID=A0A919RXS7_9CLOT|nr:TIGR01906 family membrane protein [Clostridium polyendosporum]GIM28475.1 membrane protein [Clostridium polyendosporum]